MSKYLDDIYLYFFKKNIEQLNKKKKIFEEIVFFGQERNTIINKDNYKKFKSGIEIFFNQFDGIDIPLPIKLIIDDTLKSDIFWYSPEKKAIILNINNKHISIIESMNHEFLHLLDYYNSINEQAFSEDFKNINKKLNNNKLVVNMQQNILNGFELRIENKLKAETNILYFDFNMLKLCFKLIINPQNTNKVTNKEIEMLTISNFRVFNKFLNSVNVLKGQYYLRNNDFSLMDFFNSKKEDYNDLKKFYNNINHFEKRLLYINKKYNVKNMNIKNVSEALNKISVKNFSCFLNDGISTYQNIYIMPNDMDFHEVRNMYYTPTLKILTEQINSLLIKKMVELKTRNMDSTYLFNASEKLSYCGQKNIGNIINEYLKVSINKEYKFNFINQTIEKECFEISKRSKKAFKSFIVMQNEYILFNPLNNKKDNVVKKEESKIDININLPTLNNLDNKKLSDNKNQDRKMKTISKLKR